MTLPMYTLTLLGDWVLTVLDEDNKVIEVSLNGVSFISCLC